MNLFYLFALQWNYLTNNHTIHGLWPQLSEHRWPEFCTTEKFDINQIQNLVPILNIVWPSVNSRHDNEYNEYNEVCGDDDNGINIYSNNDFWKHEWMRHGTCNYNHFNQYHYFDKAVELYNQLGVKYQCHSHLSCLIKFDINFEIVN